MERIDNKKAPHPKLDPARTTLERDFAAEGAGYFSTVSYVSVGSNAVDRLGVDD